MGLEDEEKVLLKVVNKRPRGGIGKKNDRVWETRNILPSTKPWEKTPRPQRGSADTGQRKGPLTSRGCFHTLRKTRDPKREKKVPSPRRTGRRPQPQKRDTHLQNASIYLQNLQGKRRGEYGKPRLVGKETRRKRGKSRSSSKGYSLMRIQDGGERGSLELSQTFGEVI